MVARSPVVPAVVVVVRPAGYLEGLDGSDTVGPGEYSNRPPELNAETVTPDEEAYWNTRIVEEGIAERQEVDGGAGVVSVTGRDGGEGFEVVVAVGFYRTFGDHASGQPTGIADGRSYEATDVANETTTRRVGDAH
jgi:hypothetical protein